MITMRKKVIYPSHDKIVEYNALALTAIKVKKADKPEVLVAKDFIISNSERFKIKDDPIYAKVMRGIRENYYSNEEIKEWMKNGKIREFKR